MIGKTNSLVGGKYKGEKVNLTLSTNQASNSDILGVNVTVEYDNKSMEYKWQGTELLIEIPPYVDYTITYSSVSGYKTPQSYSAKSVEDNSKTINATYQTELLTVTVTSDIELPTSYTITVSGIGSQTTPNKTYKIPFGTSYTITASSAKGYNEVDEQSYTASQARRDVSVVYLEKTFSLPSISGAIDLSKQDIYGASISTTTANCYVVSAKGTYAFPLVYGNAIKNGEINASAYTNNGSNHCHDFVNHLDNIISSPYIEDHEGCVAASAELTLSNSSDIKNITLVKGGACKYVQFDVTDIWSSSCNAVISVLDADGTIMWSWFIWIKKDLKTITITNSSSVNYDILSLHLASASSGITAYNWYYQWGRHIPQPGPNSFNSNSEESSNYGVRTFTISSNPASSLGEAIRNPHVYYHSNGGWFDTFSFYNLWDASCTSTGASDNNVVKTVYDPCPVGFKVPPARAFSYFSKTNTVGNFMFGWYFKRNSSDNTGVFFPVSGYRYKGALQQVGSYGYVWSANVAYVNNYAYHLSFYNGGATWDNYSFINTCMSVRPVTEDSPYSGGGSSSGGGGSN